MNKKNISYNFITDRAGFVYEFFLNLPFGETMAEQHSQTADYVNKWKFTGHELDRETGLYYAKARYYDPKISVFMSVDPLLEKYPSWSPYNYTLNNPINLVDPTGMEADSPDNEYRIYKKGGIVQRIEYVSNKGGNEIDFITEVNLDKSAVESGAYNSYFIPVKNEKQTLSTPFASQDGEIIRSERSPGYNLDVTYKVQSQALQSNDFDSPFFIAGGFLKNAVGKGSVGKQGKELFKFGGSAGRHMVDKNRAVPIQILEQTINGSKGISDPKGSRALLHTSEMWKNGKAYNLEVLYDKPTNTIWHFKYSPKKFK